MWYQVVSGSDAKREALAASASSLIFLRFPAAAALLSMIKNLPGYKSRRGRDERTQFIRKETTGDRGLSNDQ